LAHDSIHAPAPPGRRQQANSPAAGTGPVIGRVLQILGAFTADHPNLSLSDLARRAGLPVSTVHRMLGDLLAWEHWSGTRRDVTA
jgi:AraC-like DNA-binding protein